MCFEFRLNKGLLVSILLFILLSPLGYAEPNAKFQTLDDLFQLVGNADKRFAGLYVEGDQLTINVTGGQLSTAEKSRLVANVRDIFGGHIGEYLQKEPNFKNVEYSISELIKWHQRIVSIHNKPDIVFSDVNERRNRVVVGITPEGDMKAAVKELRSLGIPENMLVLERSNFMREQKSVRSRFRPLTAGVQLDTGFFGRCTIGVIVSFPNGRGGAITNSHCSQVRGVVDGTLFKQPQNGILGSNAIGLEIADPPYNVVHPACAPGRSCRWSDSNLIQVDSNVSFDRGTIARVGSWGSRTISTADDDYQVTEVALWSLSGEVLTKIGRTTGKTAGVVSSTCLSLNVRATNFTHLCQTRVIRDTGVGGNVTPLSGSGDSGSPVFKLLPGSNPTHNVRLYGILWGGDDFGTQFAYSGMLLTVLELQQAAGSFTVVQ